jgi:hypothetical protein
VLVVGVTLPVAGGLPPSHLVQSMPNGCCTNLVSIKWSGDFCHPKRVFSRFI